VTPIFPHIRPASSDIIFRSSSVSYSHWQY